MARADVIEIDGASNNSVDRVQDGMIVNTPRPVQLQDLIIDEVHADDGG